MKSFVFSLDRMRNYKLQLLDKEKNILGRLRKAKEEIEQKIIFLKKYLKQIREEIKVKQEQGITAVEMNAFHFLLENTNRQIEELYLALEKAEKEVEHQLKIVVKASQEVSALDKLEEKQLEEYHILENKENELKILEYVTTDLVREQARS